MPVFIILAYLLFPKQIDRVADIGHITHDQAAEHIIAALLAGTEYQVKPSKLLAIAWHESNFKHTERTKEPGRRVSCGAMTPDPKRRCDPEDLTILGSYFAGAKHYRMWLDIWHTYHNADIAYAGGGVCVRLCARRSSVLSPTGHNVCDYPYDLQDRARVLMRE